MDASDADAMPLPSEDTTPPVTKIREVMVGPCVESFILAEALRATNARPDLRRHGRRDTMDGLHLETTNALTDCLHDPCHNPRTHRRAARRDAPARRRRLRRDHRRSTPFRIPAGALAGARMAVGLHRFRRNIGRDAAICRIVD